LSPFFKRITSQEASASEFRTFAAQIEELKSFLWLRIKKREIKLSARPDL
jgi:hypothetical protein